MRDVTIDNINVIQQVENITYMINQYCIDMHWR